MFMRFIGCKDKLRDRMRCKDQEDVGSGDQSGLIWRKHKMWEMTDHAHRPRLACHSTAAPVGRGERGEGVVVEHRVVGRRLGTLLKHLRWKDVTKNNAPETFQFAKMWLKERLPADRRATSRTSYSCSFHCSETLIKEPFRKIQIWDSPL